MLTQGLSVLGVNVLVLERLIGPVNITQQKKIRKQRFVGS
jgi:hypothetical protein